MDVHLARLASASGREVTINFRKLASGEKYRCEV